MATDTKARKKILEDKHKKAFEYKTKLQCDVPGMCKASR